MCVYVEKKVFFVYRNVGVQRKKKAFLIDSDGCIVFCKHVEEKMKQKEKRKIYSSVNFRSLLLMRKPTYWI